MARPTCASSRSSTPGTSGPPSPPGTGSYTVGGGEVVRGAEAQERVALDVRQLAQLYAGYLPARELARYGLVEPGTPGALELLGELFPPGEPWIYPPDHF